MMPDIGRSRIPVVVSDHIDKFDIRSPVEMQTDMVDSMSPPHAAEYISAQHALALDCATLQRIDNDMDACRTRIARAHAEMHFLERQRSAVQQRVAVHRARLSPLRTVPDQVLQEIFQHCLPDTPYVVPSARAAPLVLTHVCRRWRAVAHGSSELWASIALHDRGVWNYELEVEMVTRWLDRSCTRPIRMRITCLPCTDFGQHGNALCSDLFQVAIAHSAHMKELCLNVNKTYLHHFMSQARLPALRSILVSLHSVQRIDDPTEPTPPAAIAAPHLRHITLKGDGTAIHFLPRALYPQITHLALDCNLTLDLARLFHDFPHLTHLALTLSLARTALRFRTPPPEPARIHAAALRTLELRLDRDMLEFGDPGTLAGVLDPLDLPALRTLVIVAPRRARYDPQTGCTEDDARWMRSPSADALLARSRYARPRLVRRQVHAHPGLPDGQGPHWDEAFENGA